MVGIVTPNQLNGLSVEELKQGILRLTEGRDTEPLSQKVLFHKNELMPWFEELSRRNPFPNVEDQALLVPGVWSLEWSTIPFQDILPGRIREQTYQIFHSDGYYANIARYAPGNKLPFLQKLSSILIAYDLMLVQSFKIVNGHWLIQNVVIEQAVRMRAISLSIEKADAWFTAAVRSHAKSHSQTGDLAKDPQLGNLDKSAAKKLKTAFLATPQLEHLYIDHDFRIVKSQREAKQRPSYTVSVRLK